MSVSDRRRLLGPSSAKIPSVGQSSSSTSTLSNTLVNNDNNNDSKLSNDIRKFFIKTGLINNANGSSYIEIEDTIIEVAVFGPRPIRGSFIDRASFSVECKFLPYIEQPNDKTFNESTNNGNGNKNGRNGLTNIEQKISTYVETSLLSSILLEKYPKSTIDIFINVISFNSKKNSLLNLINWIINSSSIALVDSGIECKDIVTSGQVILNQKTNELLLDSSIIEQKNKNIESNLIECVISFMNMKNNEIVAIWIDGETSEVNEDILNKLIDGCDKMSKKIRLNLNNYLINSINNEVEIDK